MANENGDYLSRFERIEKTLEQTALLTLALADRMDRAEKRMDQYDARIDKLAAKVDDLVGAIRSLIDRIPPQSLRSS
jgi:ABC-type transporter Mla subunit MlaD